MMRHRARRIAREPSLKPPADWIREAREPGPRPRKREDLVPDRAVLPIPFDREALFATLGVLRQRAVREREPADRIVLVDDVRDPAGMQRPQPIRANENCDRRPRLDR